MALEGKGMFTWKLPNIEGGDPDRIATVAKSAALTHVLIKVADGGTVYNGAWGDAKDYVSPTIAALRAAGIKVWGWQYVYGRNPAAEAAVAIARIRQYNLDGYAIDAEREYKEEGKRAAAKKYMSLLRAALPSLDIALCSYRFPSLHTQIPWAEFLEGCTLNMPQVYWMKAHNPAAQLAKSVREFQNLRPSRPIVPVGAAFRESGWQPTAAEVEDFMQAAKNLNLSGVNFWEWSDARGGILPNVWETIRDYPWSDTQAPKDIVEKYINALNTHDVNSMLGLYTSTAVHINSARTTQGLDNLRIWYTQLFNDILPNATFTMTGYSGTGASRHLTWTATSTKGVVQNGNDTLGLLNDRINYHYSFFTVVRT